nr:MAG TPA: hypothetical protein [Caudoviricetes sp.]
MYKLHNYGATTQLYFVAYSGLTIQLYNGILYPYQTTNQQTKRRRKENEKI